MTRPFSYKEYVQILDWVKSNYKIVQYSDINVDTKGFCVIRHDVEYSIERAYELAKLEEAMGLKTTYLIQIRNNCYNALSTKNIPLIEEIKNMGHEIGLHVHCGLLSSYKDIIELVKNDISILSKGINSSPKIFSFHRPSIKLLQSNIKIPGLINAYGDLYFHAYKGKQPKNIKVKYISDSNHMWKYGYPNTTSNPKLQLNFHPFSWTKKGHENTPNFKALINEKNKEMIKSISNEIRTFPTNLLL